jgi:hypothetical protein
MQMSGSGFFQFSNVGFIFFSLGFFFTISLNQVNILSLKNWFEFHSIDFGIATRLTPSSKISSSSREWRFLFSYERYSSKIAC